MSLMWLLKLKASKTYVIKQGKLKGQQDFDDVDASRIQFLSLEVVLKEIHVMGAFHYTRDSGNSV